MQGYPHLGKARGGVGPACAVEPEGVGVMLVESKEHVLGARSARNLLESDFVRMLLCMLHLSLHTVRTQQTFVFSWRAIQALLIIPF